MSGANLGLLARHRTYVKERRAVSLWPAENQPRHKRPVCPGSSAERFSTTAQPHMRVFGVLQYTSRYPADARVEFHQVLTSRIPSPVPFAASALLERRYV